jgi:hypothetical protein
LKLQQTVVDIAIDVVVGIDLVIVVAIVPIRSIVTEIANDRAVAIDCLSISIHWSTSELSLR